MDTHRNLLFTLLALPPFRQKVSPFGTDMPAWKAQYSFGKFFPALARQRKKNETMEDFSSAFWSKLAQGRNA